MENSFSRTSSHVLSKSIFDIKNYKKTLKTYPHYLWIKLWISLLTIISSVTTEAFIRID